MVNNLRWHPSRQCIMTTGNDPCIRVFDLRKPEAPLLELTGHLSGRCTLAHSEA